MYNAFTLQQNFSGLVGFFQPYDPAYNRIPAFLNDSLSGRYVQLMHPLCTLENLYNIGPEFDKFDFPAWVNQGYEKGSIVASGGKLWRAEGAIAVDYGEPLAGAEYVEEYGAEYNVNALWKEYEPFTDWLLQNYKASVLELFADFIRARKLDNANKVLLDSQILFDGIGSYADRVIKSNRFVGFQIKVSSQQGLQAQINKLGLQLDGAQVVKFYLYHSSVLEPLKTFDITVGKASTFNWQNVTDAILKFYEDNHDASGTFLLGYYEADLQSGIQAINREYNFRTGPCMGCNEYNWNAFNKWSKYVKIFPFSVGSAYLDGGKNLFDTSKIAYQPSTNFGINISLTIACDLTEFFTTNKLMFGDALGMKVCLKLLNQTAYSTRMNGISDKTKALAMADLSVDTKDSFINTYLKELKALAVDFSGISSACLPAQRNGVTVGAL